jgi:hypothetical protein
MPQLRTEIVITFWPIRIIIHSRGGCKYIQKNNMIIGKGKLKFLEENLPQYNCVDQNPYIDYSSIKPQSSVMRNWHLIA